MVRDLISSRHAGAGRICAALLLVALLVSIAVRADEPYAPTRDYDLQNIRTHLWFDVDNRKIRGEAVETISALRDSVSQLRFDSVALKIESVAVDGAPVKFSTTATELTVTTCAPGETGRKARSFDSIWRSADERRLHCTARQELSTAAEGNLHARRSRRYALLHPHLRLPERPDHLRDDFDSPRKLDHHFEWPTRRA